MYKGIIFDLDGTVLDTIADIADATNAAMAKMGFHSSYSNEEVMKMVGNGFKVLIEKAVPAGTSECDVDKALAYFVEAYEECYTNKTSAFIGVDKAIALLEEKGIKLAVNSNKRDDFTNLLIKKCYPDTNWVAVVGARDGKKRKPDPEAALEIAAEMGLEIDEVIYIGDSEVDITTGKNAGMATMAVSWGYRPLEVVMNANPSYLVKTPEEMLEIILK